MFLNTSFAYYFSSLICLTLKLIFDNKHFVLPYSFDVVSILSNYRYCGCRYRDTFDLCAVKYLLSIAFQHWYYVNGVWIQPSMLGPSSVQCWFYSLVDLKMRLLLIALTLFHWSVIIWHCLIWYCSTWSANAISTYLCVHSECLYFRSIHDPWKRSHTVI